MGLGDTILTGIVSGIIASVCFTMIMLMIKPKVVISGDICAERTDTGFVHRVKIVNRTFAMITNLRYSLHYCVMHGDGICTIEEIKPRKTPLMSIDRFCLKKDNTDYAVRISYDIDSKKYPLHENSKLIFRFIADHAWSNTTVCKKVEYCKNNIIVGVFESDKSVKIIRENPVRNS